MQALGKHGVRAELHSSSAEILPFADATFDVIVSVSALEYIPDINRACREMLRVLKPEGHLVCVTPGFSPLVDWGLKQMTGEQASQYGDRRERLMPALHAHFKTERELAVPPLAGRLLRLYTALRMQRR
jgi:ubiquinone/menaquinone biosynthesis C-methylase UbiE